MFMAVGTGNIDDYYPYFVFEYTPELLSFNTQYLSDPIDKYEEASHVIS